MARAIQEGPARWKDLELKERWGLIAATVQAVATFGAFLVALVGVWKVAPIITYQVQQQQEAEALEQQAVASIPASHEVAEAFSADAALWWSGQVRSYQRVLDLIDAKAKRNLKVGFEVRESAGPQDVPGVVPDMLIVTATELDGKKDWVRVSVNEKAVSPTQYIQCKINQGAFAGLAPAKRRAAEAAVERYLHNVMLPKVAPPHVRPDMSLQELYQEISNHQPRRLDARRQIQALKGVIDSALQER